MSFYLAGCQRSGTTLLRLILNSHSAITCHDEAVAYQYFLNPAEVPEVKPGTRITGYKIPRFAEQLLSDVVSDTDYPHISQFFSEQDEILFITRNVLDVIASMKSLPVTEEISWLQKYGVEILQYKMQSPAFRQKYSREIEIVEQSNYSEGAVGALYWKYKNDARFEYEKRGLKIFPLHYEELVSSPRSVIEGIADFLNVPFEDSLLNHHKQTHGELEANGKAIGGTDPSRAIFTSSVGRHRNVLSEEDLHLIEKIVGPLEAQRACA